MENKEKPKKDKKPKKKTAKPGRGIESMYRISMNSHVQLTKIADNKSNILISVNAIIISVMLSTLLPDLMNGKYQNFKVPFGIIMLTCVLTVVIAIIATIPKNNIKYTDSKNTEINYGDYLFFGNFYKMTMDEYVIGMRDFQNDESFPYDALSQNFYILGKVLAKKYFFLNIAYRIFLVGFIVSMISILYIVFR